MEYKIGCNENSPVQASYQPSEVLVNNWKLWMACEVVDRWQSTSQINYKFENILSQNHKQVLSSSLSKLEHEIQQQRNSANSIKVFEMSQNSIKKYWFNKIIREHQQTIQATRAKSIDSIRELVSINDQLANPKLLTIFLTNLCNALTNCKRDSEKKKIEFLRRENSAWQAYFKLSSKLRSTPLNSMNMIDFKSEEQKVWNAIYICLESIINIEHYSAYSQATQSLLQLCQTYNDSAQRSFEILNRLQKSLRKKSTLDIVSLPVFTRLNRVNASQQKKLIEIWIGHSIIHWGNSPVSWQQIEAKLLENIEPVALKTCLDFQHCFMEHIRPVRDG